MTASRIGAQTDPRHRDGVARAGSSEQRRPGARPHRPAARTPTVIVGYDGSDDARAALSAGLEHAGPRGTVIVAHAIPPAAGAPRAARERRFTQLTTEASAQLMQPLSHSTADNPREIRVIPGAAADVLTRLAVARRADLIVVGARGRGRRTALGSVVATLLRQADCPVLVVPAGGDARQPGN